MALIDDNIAQVRQDAAELAVHGQDAAVQHVGVGDQQLRTVPRLPANALTSHMAEVSMHSRQAQHAAKNLTVMRSSPWSGSASQHKCEITAHLSSVAIIDLHARSTGTKGSGAHLLECPTLILRGNRIIPSQERV